MFAAGRADLLRLRTRKSLEAKKRKSSGCEINSHEENLHDDSTDTVLKNKEFKIVTENDSAKDAKCWQVVVNG